MGDSHAPTLLPSWVRLSPSTLGHVLNKPSRTGGSEAPCTLRHHPPLDPASSQPGGYRCRGGLQGAHLGPRARRAGDGPPSHGRVWALSTLANTLMGVFLSAALLWRDRRWSGVLKLCVDGVRGANGGRLRSPLCPRQARRASRASACASGQPIYLFYTTFSGAEAVVLFVCHLLEKKDI